MLSEVIYPDDYSFVGNPMVVTFLGDSVEEVIFDIKYKDQTIIELSLVLFGNDNEYKGSLNIEKYLVPFFEKLNYNGGDIISSLDSFCIEYTIDLKNYLQADFRQFKGKAFYGGISDNNYAWLKSWSMNMFSYRLRNYEHQFLFTTRTNSSHLLLRESELHPFVFIHPGETISISTSSGRILIPEIFQKDTVCLLDVEAIRRSIFDAYKELPSFLAINVGTLTVFEISITPAQISEEHYLLRFKNSLGAFEIIEITGKATDKIAFSEETTWQGYNQYSFFEEKRNRVPSTKELLAHTGYKTKSELQFIVDMIKSDEIYLIDSGKEIKCLVTPDELQIPRQITEPQSIVLKIRFLTEDQYESPEIVMDYPTRIFQNITAKGKPEIYGDCFIHADDYPFYAE